MQKTIHHYLILVTLGLFVLLLLMTNRAVANEVNTLLDDTTPDNGLVSLREAVEQANTDAGADSVHFAANLQGEIELTEGEIAITDELTIDGPGANTLAVSGGDASRVFNIAVGTTVTISRLKICNGLADGSAPDLPGSGGGILNQGNLTLNHVVMAGNRAMGDADVDVQFNDVQLVAGLGGGGAVASYDQLQANHCSFFGNAAVGADETIRDFPAFPTKPWGSGIGIGGAIFSGYGINVEEIPIATFNHCQFGDNLAKAGSDGVGDFAGVSLGGAIANEGSLTVSHSSFGDNRSEGGSRTVSPLNNGQGDGGAIACGSIRPLVVPDFPGSSVSISHCSFNHNICTGGDENIAVAPPEAIPRASGPNNSHGGAIVVWQGTANIEYTTVSHNSAIAGNGGAELNGSLGIGGGIFLFGYLGEVTADVRHLNVSGNQAIGGSGVEGSAGGSGIGGGLAIGSFGSLFGVSTNVDISRSAVWNNEARGGDGSQGAAAGNGDGGGIANAAGANTTASKNSFMFNRAQGGTSNGGGGNGHGGGILNEEGASLTLVRDLIFFNSAIGGDGDGSDGTGFGGGIFNAGIIDIDAITEWLTRWNHADEGDNFFGL